MIVKLQNATGKEIFKCGLEGEKNHIITKGWQTDSNRDSTGLGRKKNFCHWNTGKTSVNQDFYTQLKQHLKVWVNGHFSDTPMPTAFIYQSLKELQRETSPYKTVNSEEDIGLKKQSWS